MQSQYKWVTFMIILIGGEKGGPGKTTIATNLAAIRTKKSKDLLLMGLLPAKKWVLSYQKNIF